ncbi:MAG: YbhB/YbcL family Raf kinase inhibitor-like protein [Geminicoccaceae bacterium]
MASAAWCVIAVDLHLQGASGLTWRNALAVEDSLKFERSKKKEVGLSLRLWSPAFGKGEDIPKRFTADGENLSSAFNWSGAPDDTKSSLLVCDDPDAPGEVFLHWVAYSTPADRIELREGYGPENGFQQAINDFGKRGYGGPAPPKGNAAHHYDFRLSALSEATPLVASSASCLEVIITARTNVIEFVAWIGLYGR